MIKLTIFTPVYNRCHTLSRLYESLKEQTNKNFEWLLVDDGSTDGTEKLAMAWSKEERGFSFRYFKTSHGGKHRAINFAVREAKAEAFFIVDSDDYLSAEAAEWIIKKFSCIAGGSSFAGIAGLRQVPSAAIIGGQPSFSDYVDATNLERPLYGLMGDKAEIYKTSVLRRFPFPEFEGEDFLTESVVWDDIALHGLLLRWFNKSIYFCEYLADGLTALSYEKFRDNPRGWARLICLNKAIHRVGFSWLNECFFFYERQNIRLSRKVIQELLEIDNDFLNQLSEMYDEIYESIEQFLLENRIRSVAIYGGGTNGKRFMRYLLDMGVKVSYIIDNKTEFMHGYSVYHLNKNLPNVDGIFVSPQKGTENIIDDIQSYNLNATIFSCYDIKGFVKK